MASAIGPPGPDISQANKFITITGIFISFGLILYIARIYTRVRPTYRVGWDDWAISVSVILMVTEWSLCVQAAPHGFGRHNYYVPVDGQIQASRLLFLVQPMWVWSVAFVKISMACMMLRILRSSNWHLFLYATIVVQVISSTAFMFILLLQCRPVYAIWDPATPGAKCWDPLPVQIGLYTNAAISIVTDFIFTLLPITFISKMNLPLRQRVVIGSLMCLGLFATGAGIAKTSLVKTYNNGNDNLYRMVDLYLWGFLEEEIGVIALCIPCLKAPFENALRRFNFLSSDASRSRTARGRSGYENFGGSQNHQLEEMRARSHRHVGSTIAETQSQEAILPINKGGEIVKTTELVFVTQNANDVEKR